MTHSDEDFEVLRQGFLVLADELPHYLTNIPSSIQQMSNSLAQALYEDCLASPNEIEQILAAERVARG